jgi:site-specific recombinase XerD
MSMQGDAIRWDLYPHVASIPHARAFILRLQQFARRPKTIDAYARNLDRFLATFVGAPAERWIEADEGDLLTYLDDLRHGRGRDAARRRRTVPMNVVHLSGSHAAATTIAQHVVALRQFYDYLIRAALRHDGSNPLPRGSTGQGGDTPRQQAMRAPAHLPWIAPPAVWDRIVLHIVLHETARNRALLLVTYDGALRREEVVGLRADDYDRHRALLRIRAETSKSGRERWVPLSPFGQRALDHYLDRHRRALVGTYGIPEPGPLFLSESTRNPGGCLAPGAVNDVIEALRAALGLPQLRPHTLRHQRLSALKAAGVPLEDIALFAGHASTETTRLYLHLTPVELGAKIRVATRATDAHLERLLHERLHEP